MGNFNYLPMDAYAKSTKLNMSKSLHKETQSIRDAFHRAEEDLKTKDYVYKDILAENYINNLLNSGYTTSINNSNKMPQIKDVKFNGPATIVFFDDNTKVVIKCNDTDIFDPEKAVMICVLRKALGMSGSQFKKWVGKWTKAYEEPTETWNSIEEICQAIKNVFHV